MRMFLITLLLITLVAIIGSRGSTIDPRPQPRPTVQHDRLVDELESALSELETLVALQEHFQRSRDHNLRRLATRARGDR